MILYIIVSLGEAKAWSRKGHDIICHIAECHLSENAAREIADLLDGYSIIYHGSWMDSASHSPKYDHTRTWHYYNIDRGESVRSAKREKKGDLLTGIAFAQEQLSDKTLSREKRAVALKMYIHLVADLHQPLHLGRKSDRGGNEVPVTYFIESTSLHTLWDYHIVEGAHSWSYTEWQQQIDRPTDEHLSDILALSTPLEWAEQTHVLTQEIYRRTPTEKRVGYDYLDYFRPKVEEQLLRAGRRLADRLNILLD